MANLSILPDGIYVLSSLSLQFLWTTMGRFGSNKFFWSNQLTQNLWIIDKLELSKNALAFSNRSIWVGSLKKFSGLNIDSLLFRLLVKCALPIPTIHIYIVLEICCNLAILFLSIYHLYINVLNCFISMDSFVFVSGSTAATNHQGGIGTIRFNWFAFRTKDFRASKMQKIPTSLMLQNFTTMYKNFKCLITKSRERKIKY